MIGLKIQDINVGDAVWYYSWIDKENECHSEPTKSIIMHEPYQSSSGDIVCFIDGVSGYVLTSHLSKEYFPGNLYQKSVAKNRYKEYLRLDFHNSFAEFMGFSRLLFDYNRDGMVCVYSEKTGLRSDYFRYKKDAKADYKEKRKAKKQSQHRYKTATD